MRVAPLSQGLGLALGAVLAYRGVTGNLLNLLTASKQCTPKTMLVC